MPGPTGRAYHALRLKRGEITQAEFDRIMAAQAAYVSKPSWWQKVLETALPIVVTAGMGAGVAGALGGGAGTAGLAPGAAAETGIAGATFPGSLGGGLSTAAGTVPGAAGVLTPSLSSILGGAAQLPNVTGVLGNVARDAGVPGAGVISNVLGGETAGGSSMGLGDLFSNIFNSGGGGGGGFLGGLGDFLGSDTFGNITDLLGAGLQGYGAYKGYRAGRDLQNTQQNILQGLQGTQLGPFAGLGLGGVGGGFDPASGTSIFGGGELDPIRQLLTLYATGSVPGIGQGVPAGVQGAAGQGALPEYASSALLQAFGGLNPALENLNTAGGAGFQDVYNRTLSNLRTQAQPFETRAFNALNEQQFAQGRAGTTGGGLQTEAFARGLGQADLSRQLQATGEARTNLSLADQLAQSAFGRFGQSAALQGGVSDVGFGRQLTMAQLPNILQGGQLANVGSALGQQGNINQQSLNNFLAALQAVSAQANARIGAGTNVAGFAGAPNFGTAALAPAAGISQIGQAIGGQTGGQGIFDILGRVLGSNAGASIESPGIPANPFPGGQIAPQFQLSNGLQYTGAFPSTGVGGYGAPGGPFNAQRFGLAPPGSGAGGGGGTVNCVTQPWLCR